jgi:hypothetical protein
VGDEFLLKLDNALLIRKYFITLFHKGPDTVGELPLPRGYGQLRLMSPDKYRLFSYAIYSGVPQDITKGVRQQYPTVYGTAGILKWAKNVGNDLIDFVTHMRTNHRHNVLPQKQQASFRRCLFCFVVIAP